MGEERIAIYVTESKIIEGNYGDFYNTISRAEAIERMAKILCQKNHSISSCDFCVCNEEGFCYGCLEAKKIEAEAALDALIKL